MDLQSLFIPHSLYFSLNLSLSLSLFLCLLAARQQYLLLGISFVLIIRINDWFGYLNASFRETSLLCHCYKLLARLCFTWGCSSTPPCIYIAYTCFYLKKNHIYTVYINTLYVLFCWCHTNTISKKKIHELKRPLRTIRCHWCNPSWQESKEGNKLMGYIHKYISSKHPPLNS